VDGLDNKWIKIVIHASTWFAPILLPLIVYFLADEREIKRLSLQAMVFHLIMSVLIGISWVFSVILIGIPFLIVFGLIAIFAPIMGILRALQERHFDYPIIGSWIR